MSEKTDPGNWIKLFRKLLSWEWYHDEKTLKLFIHLLISANWKQSRYKGVQVERGQYITGFRALAKETNLSVQSLRTCINRLKSTREITHQSTHLYSIITLCNYDKYQTNECEANTPIDTQTNKRVTQDQHATNTIQEGKKERKKEKDRSTFSPEGKTKYLDWVYLSDEEMARVQWYYERNSLDMDDLSEAIRQLDLWFDNNRHMRPKRTSDEKALKGWPMQRAIEAKKNKTLLAKAQAPKQSFYPQKGAYGLPTELPETTKILLMQANKGRIT